MARLAGRAGLWPTATEERAEREREAGTAPPLEDVCSTPQGWCLVPVVHPRGGVEEGATGPVSLLLGRFMSWIQRSSWQCWAQGPRRCGGGRGKREEREEWLGECATAERVSAVQRVT